MCNEHSQISNRNWSSYVHFYIGQNCPLPCKSIMGNIISAIPSPASVIDRKGSNRINSCISNAEKESGFFIWRNCKSLSVCLNIVRWHCVCLCIFWLCYLFPDCQHTDLYNNVIWFFKLLSLLIRYWLDTFNNILNISQKWDFL